MCQIRNYTPEGSTSRRTDKFTNRNRVGVCVCVRVRVCVCVCVYGGRGGDSRGGGGGCRRPQARGDAVNYATTATTTSVADRSTTATSNTGYKPERARQGDPPGHTTPPHTTPPLPHAQTTALHVCAYLHGARLMHYRDTLVRSRI